MLPGCLTSCLLKVITSRVLKQHLIHKLQALDLATIARVYVVQLVHLLQCRGSKSLLD